MANETKAGVYVVTTDSSTPASQMAKTYLADKVGAKNNGVVLVINMNLRKVYIWATGNLKYYLPSSRIEKTLDIVQPELTDNNYYQAVSGFFLTKFLNITKQEFQHQESILSIPKQEL